MHDHVAPCPPVYPSRLNTSPRLPIGSLPRDFLPYVRLRIQLAYFSPSPPPPSDDYSLFFFSDSKCPVVRRFLCLCWDETWLGVRGI